MMMATDATTSLLTAIVSVPHMFAYLDPGAGSMLLQILLASALSSAFFMKTWFRQVRDGLLMRNKKA